MAVNFTQYTVSLLQLLKENSFEYMDSNNTGCRLDKLHRVMGMPKRSSGITVEVEFGHCRSSRRDFAKPRLKSTSCHPNS